MAEVQADGGPGRPSVYLAARREYRAALVEYADELRDHGEPGGSAVEADSALLLMGNPRLVVQSLGAGVQSTTMLLLANHGELPGPPVDAAIFADTGWEPAAVYAHLAWLERVSEVPIIRVSA